MSNGTQPKGFAGLASLASKLEEEADREPAEEIQSDEPHAVGETARGQATAPAASGRSEHDGEGPQTGFSALSSLSSEEPAKQPATTQEGPETGGDDAELDGSEVEPAETPDTSAIAPPAEPPSPQRESIASKPTRPAPTTRSRRKWLWLWLVLIGAVAFYVFEETRKAERSELTFSKPPVGRDNVLNVAELRWCIREEIRLDTLRPLPRTNSHRNEFKRLVSDYNRRCGSYRYREGTLARARREVEQNRSEIVASVSPPREKSGPLTDVGAAARGSEPASDGRSERTLTKERGFEALRQSDPKYKEYSDDELAKWLNQAYGPEWLKVLTEMLEATEKERGAEEQKGAVPETPATMPTGPRAQGFSAPSTQGPAESTPDEAAQRAPNPSSDGESSQGVFTPERGPRAEATHETGAVQERPVPEVHSARKAPSDRQVSEEPHRPEHDRRVQIEPSITPSGMGTEPSERPQEAGTSASERASEEIEQSEPDETTRPTQIANGTAQSDTQTVGQAAEEARDSESAHRGTSPEDTEELEATKTQGTDEDPPSNRRQLIHEIQMYLTALGYEPGPIDGLYGPKTMRAIEAFERDIGMTPTGEATIGLWRKARREVKSGTEPQSREEASESTRKARQTGPGGVGATRAASNPTNPALRPERTTQDRSVEQHSGEM